MKRWYVYLFGAFVSVLILMISAQAGEPWVFMAAFCSCLGWGFACAESVIKDSNANL